jgi:hypothetical protein
MILNFSNAQTFEEDKYVHFGAGVVMGFFGYDYTWQRTYDKKKSVISGVSTAFASGVTKELIDARILKAKIDKEDLIATTLGGLVSAFILDLRNKKINYRQLDKKRGGYYYPEYYERKHQKDIDSIVRAYHKFQREQSRKR